VYITIRNIVKIYLDCKVEKGGIDDLDLNRNLEFQTFIGRVKNTTIFVVKNTRKNISRTFFIGISLFVIFLGLYMLNWL
jgi:hypothetical protein